VLIGSAKRYALMHELRGAPEPRLKQLLTRLAPVDLVIVEGYKAQPHPKLELHRAGVGKPLLYPNDSWIVAVASDLPLTDTPLPVIGLDDIETIADVLLVESMPLDQVVAADGGA
jgi:molybdopterin-guanine dinucleotide biosynthesis protein B